MKTMELSEKNAPVLRHGGGFDVRRKFEGEGTPLYELLDLKKPPKMTLLTSMENYLKNIPPNHWERNKISGAIKRSQIYHGRIIGDIKFKDLNIIHDEYLKTGSKARWNEIRSAITNSLRFACNGRQRDYSEPSKNKFMGHSKASRINDNGGEQGEIKIRHQILDFSDAKSLVHLSKGRFADMKYSIREQLRILPEGKVYAFNIPGVNSSDDKEIQAIKHACSTMITDEKIPFTVRYSTQKKLFLIFHKTELNDGRQRNRVHIQK